MAVQPVFRGAWLANSGSGRQTGWSPIRTLGDHSQDRWTIGVAAGRGRVLDMLASLRARFANGTRNALLSKLAKQKNHKEEEGQTVRDE